MYIEDLKNDFYEFISGKRLFVMAHYDIDSICACKILQNLLKFKHVLYSLAVIRGLDELKTAFSENCKEVKYFVLINCGGSIDIVEFLEPEDDVVFFVLDSHRPTDLCNIYSNGQVRLLSKADDDVEVPEFHSVFREDSDDEDSDNENDDDADDSEERASKRRRLGEEAILKRRERRLWEENRNKLLFEYSQFTYYAKASAISMYNLAWKLSKDDKDSLWLAIVALTEQYLFGKIENSVYILETGDLKLHANRLANRSNNSDASTTLRISYEKDLRLVLYRHWSVEDSLKFSTFTACKMKLWSHRGGKRLYELLADIGFPLAQSRQAFQSMDLQLRKEFHGALEKVAEKYDLQDIVFTSFLLQYGYRHKFGASDIVYALLAILESSPRDKNCEECFHLALDCLSRNKRDVIDNAIERAKIIFKTLFKTVQGAIEMKQIISAGPFLYYIIQEGCLDWYMFSQQHILSLLAQFIQRAYVPVSRNRKAQTLPLIISAPKNIEGGTCIVLGIPPLCENSPKNFFGKAFEQAADRINCEAAFDFVDTSYFEIFTKDRARFFDALTSILT